LKLQTFDRTPTILTISPQSFYNVTILYVYSLLTDHNNYVEEVIPMKRRWPKFTALAIALLLLGGMVASASAANSANSQANVLCQGLMKGSQQAQTALKAVADLTGLTAADIRSQRAEGQSLAEIAQAKGVSEQTIIDQVAGERTSTLDKLKADGTITETQYQTCLGNMQTRIKANIERTAVGSGNGCQGQGMHSNNQGRGHRNSGCNQENCPNL
jgi:competence protein ComGC